MPEPTHEAVFTVPPNDNPYQLFVLPFGGYIEPDSTPVKVFQPDFFSPTFVVLLEDFLRANGYVVTGEWADEIEWRTAPLVEINE
jgi:hypothetical protein